MPIRRGVAALLLIVLPLDLPPQCDQAVFRRNNPGICDVFPFPNFPPAGGGGSSGGGGGILDTIGRVVGGLTGGLL